MSSIFAQARASQQDLNSALILGDPELVHQLMSNGASPNAVKGIAGARFWFSALLMGEKPAIPIMSELMRIADSEEGSKRQATTG
jgi:hypothetical protein